MRRFIIVLFAAIVGSGSISAEPPASVDVKKGSPQVIAASIIPVPMEVFSALDKMGVMDWNGQLEKRDFRTTADRPRTALLLGLVISDGFMAVQAKNATEVKRIGLLVQKLAGPLGVSEPVDERIKSILEALASGQWTQVKQEMDRTRQTVLETMRKMRDAELATLVALGGWLGGTEAISSILEEDYSAEGSDLLNQTGILEELQMDFDQLSELLKEGKILKKIDRTLAGLGEWMEPDEKGVISLVKVSMIHQETRALVEAIYALDP